MEVKKSEKASLGNKRLLFMEIGFFLALLVVYGAFEYSSKEKKEKNDRSRDKSNIYKQ